MIGEKKSFIPSVRYTVCTEPMKYRTEEGGDIECTAVHGRTVRSIVVAQQNQFDVYYVKLEVLRQMSR